MTRNSTSCTKHPCAISTCSFNSLRLVNLTRNKPRSKFFPRNPNRHSQTERQLLQQDEFNRQEPRRSRLLLRLKDEDQHVACTTHLACVIRSMRGLPQIVGDGCHRYTHAFHIPWHQVRCGIQIRQYKTKCARFRVDLLFIYTTIIYTTIRTKTMTTAHRVLQYSCSTKRPDNAHTTPFNPHQATFFELLPPDGYRSEAELLRRYPMCQTSPTW